jgi:hypothetical protein
LFESKNYSQKEFADLLLWTFKVITDKKTDILKYLFLNEKIAKSFNINQNEELYIILTHWKKKA